MVTCLCCDAPFNRIGGVTTSIGYVCYNCIEWIHEISRQTQAVKNRPIKDVLKDIDETP